MQKMSFQAHYSGADQSEADKQQHGPGYQVSTALTTGFNIGLGA
jgi:hypothetical protein